MHADEVWKEHGFGELSQPQKWLQSVQQVPIEQVKDVHPVYQAALAATQRERELEVQYVCILDLVATCSTTPIIDMLAYAALICAHNVSCMHACRRIRVKQVNHMLAQQWPRRASTDFGEKMLSSPSVLDNVNPAGRQDKPKETVRHGTPGLPMLQNP